MATTVYLVRHGATAANLENRFAGRSGEPLHGDGIAQIRAVGEALKGKKISRIVASPLARTMHSAVILAGIVGVEFSADPGFNEISIPHWDGLTKEEIRAQFGGQYPAWLATPHLFRVKGCETIGDVQERAVTALEKGIAARPGEPLLVVSHLIVLRALILHYRKMEISAFRSVAISNGTIAELVL